MVKQSASSNKCLYRVSFYNEGKVFELYAHSVTTSNLFGFVELSGLAFGEKSSVLVDPNDERLRNEFSDTKRCFIPMHSIIRIDEVHKNTERKARVLSFAPDNPKSSGNKKSAATLLAYIYAQQSLYKIKAFTNRYTCLRRLTKGETAFLSFLLPQRRKNLEVY